MRQRPAFVVSFDCEGHWGMMDHLEDHGRLSSRALADAYDRLLALFDRHGIKATFAFVGAFAMSEEEARAKMRLFTESGPKARAWIAPFLADLEARRTDGWFAPAAAAAVKSSGLHELGSHGFTHLPLVEGEIELADFDREFASLRETEIFAAAKDLTLVYPRNQLGFERELARHGFIGYRESIAARRSERSSRSRHLFDEANPYPKAQEPGGPAAGTARIPAGRMLNWRSGARGRIPIAWTARSWRKTIDDAVRTGRVAHLWSHPHNFVTGKDMFELLEAVLKDAAPRVRSGELWNPTMREYAKAVLGR